METFCNRLVFLVGVLFVATVPAGLAAAPTAGATISFRVTLAETAAHGSPREQLLEGALRGKILAELQGAGASPRDLPGAGPAVALASEREGAIIAVRYRRTSTGLEIVGHILSGRKQVLVDAFATRDDLGVVRADVPGLSERTPDGQLIRLFARRMVFRLLSNPDLRIRTEQLAEAQRERFVTPEMGLPFPEHGRDDDTAGVLSIFREQKVSSATLSPRPLPEVPATVRVITAEDIRRRGYRYLHELLRDLPGFDVTFQQGLYGSIFAQRGLDQPENLRTLVLIDGVPDNNISQGSAYIKHTYGLEGVRQVEVVYGPASALYGANAFTGIINIVTKDGGEAGHTVEAGVGTTYMAESARRPARSAHATVGTVLGAGPKAANLILFGHWVDGDGPILNRRDNPDPARASYTWTDGYNASALKDNYAVGVKFRWDFLTLSARATRDYTGQGTFATERAYADDASLAYWYVRTYSTTARVDLPVGARFREKLRVTYRDTSVVDGTDADYDKSAARLGSLTITRYRRPDREISVDNPFAIRWSRSQETVAGFTYTDQNAANYNTRSQTYPNRYALALTALPVRPDADPLNKFKYTDRAAYVEHTARPWDALILTMGYRYDEFQITGADGATFCGTTEQTVAGTARNPYFLSPAEAATLGCVLRGGGQFYQPKVAEKAYTASNPRLGLVYRYDPRVSLRLLYGEAFRAPTVRELYSVSSSRTSNGTLEPERIRTVEAGATFAPLRRLVLEGAVFHNAVRDMILLAGTDIHRPGKSTGSNLSRFQNAGRAQVDGIEVTAEAGWRDTWRFYAGYTYQRARLFDVSEPGLTAHDRRSNGIPVRDNVSTCREVLETQGYGLLRAQCGGYSGEMPRVARNKIQLGSYIEPVPRFLINLRTTWVENRMNISTNPNPSVPSYLLVNLGFGTRDWPADGLDIRFQVENLLNADILDPGFRDGSGSYFPAAHPQPGRWFGWEVSYRI